MLLVKDTAESRHQLIRSFLRSDPMIAVILAAADFEWTIRRTILALGVSTTKEIKKQLEIERVAGLDRYRDFWKREVKPHLANDLANVVPDWQALKEAFRFRNVLVHGISGTISVTYASRAVEAILLASEALVHYAENHKAPIYGKRIVRRKRRSP
jgi:hypothetical protein